MSNKFYVKQRSQSSFKSSRRNRIYEGILFKRGKVNKAWKQRWFVMNGEFKLNYYETEKLSLETFIVKNDRNVLGSIDLLQIEKIEVSLINDLDVKEIPKYIKVAKKIENNEKNEDNNNNKSDKDDRKYLIHLVTSNRTFKLSANNKESFLKWLKYLHKYLYDGSLFESYMDKKGEVNKSFKRRYFVLNKFKQLKYYNNEEREVMHGFIDLNDPSIEFNLPKDEFYFNQPNIIELISEKRTWVLSSTEQIVFKEWCSLLSKFKEMETVKPRKSVVKKELKELKEIKKEPGAVGREWFIAQQQMKSGKQPTVCQEHGVKLEHMNKPRRTRTVFELQSILDIATGKSNINRPQLISHDTDVSDDDINFDELLNDTLTTLEQNDTLFEIVQSPNNGPAEMEDFLGIEEE